MLVQLGADPLIPEGARDIRHQLVHMPGERAVEGAEDGQRPFQKVRPRPGGEDGSQLFVGTPTCPKLEQDVGGSDAVRGYQTDKESGFFHLTPQLLVETNADCIAVAGQARAPYLSVRDVEGAPQEFSQGPGYVLVPGAVANEHIYIHVNLSDRDGGVSPETVDGRAVKIGHTRPHIKNARTCTIISNLRYSVSYLLATAFSRR